MNFELYSRSSSSHAKLQSLQIKKNGPANLFNSRSSKEYFPNLEKNSSQKLTSKKNSELIMETSKIDQRLAFPMRPDTCNISSLTLKENEKVSVHNSLIGSPKLQKHFVSQQSESNLKLPSQNDFEKILYNLDAVSLSKNIGHKRLLISEGESFSVLLEKFNFQYCTIECLNKKPPLSVCLIRKKGKLISYYSKYNPEPSKILCENYSKKDFFQINDYGVKFKNNYFYIGIEAVSDSEFSISIKFGKELNHKKLKIFELNDEVFQASLNEKKIEALENDTNSVAQTERIRKSEENKNFIKINKSNSKFKMIGSLSYKHLDWKIRRENALKNKNAMLKKKKDKALGIINRTSIRKNNEKLENERIEKIKGILNMQKFWIKFIYFGNYFFTLKSKFDGKKLIILKNFREKYIIIKLQRRIKKKLKYDTQQICISRGLNCLRLFLSTNSIFVKWNIIKCIKASQQNLKVAYSLKKFFEKVIFIQRKFRLYSKFLATLKHKIIKMWDSILEEQLLKFGRSLSKKKGRRESRMLVSISKATRDFMINNFIKQTQLKYLHEFRIFKENIKKNGNTLITNNYEVLQISRYSKNFGVPVLNLMPEFTEIRKLLEKAKNFSIKMT